MPFDDRTSSLRESKLAPSGGWLGETVILLADLFGAWDIFILMGIFVFSWVVIRTTSCETSAILGLIYDLGIPLQYQNDEELTTKHEEHLAGYWPVFLISSLIEAASYVFCHPNLFTLVVCMKTNVCVVVWLMKAPDAVRVLPYRVPQPSSGIAPTGIPPLLATTTPRPAPPPPSYSEPPRGRYPFPVDSRFPDANKDLKAAGYTDPLAREGFIYHLLGEPDHKRARQNLRNWLRSGRNPSKSAQKTKRYRDRAMQEREYIDRRRSIENQLPESSVAHGADSARHLGSGQAGRLGSGIVGGTSNGYRPMSIPQEELAQIDKHLYSLSSGSKGIKYWSDPQNRQGYIQELQACKDPEELKKKLVAAGFLSQSWKTHNLDDQFRPDTLQQRRKMLTDGDDGLGMPQDIADLMIDDMLNQKTVDQANRLYGDWHDLSQTPRGPRRTKDTVNLLKKYQKYVSEAPKSKTTRVGWAT